MNIFVTSTTVVLIEFVIKSYNGFMTANVKTSHLAV